MAHEAPLYPVALVVSGRPCLVVGGGPVAARKVVGLVGCGAAVTVVAPGVVDQIRELATDPDHAKDRVHGHAKGHGQPGSVAIETRPYRRGEAGAYCLVVTATGVPEVDHAVASDAELAGVWVNSADDVANCTFLLPAVHRVGPVTVAVSTGGASPALAGWLRSRIAETTGPEVATLAVLLDEARNRIRAAGRSTETVDWTMILDDRVVPLVRSGRIDEARAVLRSLTSSPGSKPGDS